MFSYGNSKGYSLVEVLVAIVILPFVLAGVYAGYLSMETTRSVQGQVTEMQRNARSAMHMILQDLRQAGYGMTEMPDIPIWQYNYDTNSTIPVYAVKSPMSDIFLGTKTKLANTDTVELFYNTYASQNTPPLKVDGSKTNEISASITFMTDVGGLKAGDIVVAYDNTVNPPQALVYEITDVDPPPGSIKIGHNVGQSGTTVNAPGGKIPFTSNWTENSGIINLNLSSGNWVGYFVDSNNNLIRSAKKRIGTEWKTDQKIVAGGIEDLQIEYTFFNGSTGELPTVSSWVSGAAPTENTTSGPTKIRSISIGIIARTAKPDLKYTDNTVYKLKNGINHGGEGYRRMVLTSDVAFRNLMAKDNNSL